MGFKLSRIITVISVGGILNVPAGASQIYLYNKGGADGKIRGLSAKTFGLIPVDVDLPTGSSFAFEDQGGKSYDGLRVDSTGTEIHITIVYG